jgi:hypothetical protein
MSVEKLYQLKDMLSPISCVYVPAIGSIVVLISGSPPMSVVDTDGIGNDITVSWRNEENDRVHEMTLPSSCLEIYDETKAHYEEELKN